MITILLGVWFACQTAPSDTLLVHLKNRVDTVYRTTEASEVENGYIIPTKEKKFLQFALLRNGDCRTTEQDDRWPSKDTFFVTDAGHWTWERHGIIHVQMSHASFTFTILRYHEDYFLVPADRENQFIADLVARRNKFKSDRPVNIFGKSYTPENITADHLAGIYHIGFRKYGAP